MAQSRPFRTVLLVDDHPLDTFITTAILRRMHLCEQLPVVSSGQEALAYLRTHQHPGHYPDVILLDLLMPGMDGFGFLEQALSQRLLLAGVKTLVLTCSVWPKDFVRAQRYPLTGYLIKPLIPQELLSALELEPVTKPV